MNAYWPEAQEAAMRKIDDEGHRCATCGDLLTADGAEILDPYTVRVSAHCGHGGHNAYRFSVTTDELY